MDKQAAEDFAARVVAYWQAQGITTVRTWVVSEAANDNKQLVYGVRSNLVGGLPPREIDKAA